MTGLLRKLLAVVAIAYPILFLIVTLLRIRYRHRPGELPKGDVEELLHYLGTDDP